MRRDFGADSSKATHYVRKTNFADWNVDSKLLGFAYRVCSSCRADQSFRRYTAIIKTVSAHKVPLNESNSRAQDCRACGRNKTGGSRPNYHQVVNASRPRIGPAGRMNIFN